MEETVADNLRSRSRSRSSTPLPRTDRDSPGRTISINPEPIAEETEIFTSPPAHRTRNALKQKPVNEKFATDSEGYQEGLFVSPISKENYISEEVAQNIRNYTYEYEQVTTSRTFTSPNTNGSHSYALSSSSLSNRSRTCSDKSNESFAESVLADSSKVSVEGTDHLPYRVYKFAIEYWNKYPKTDYTYSHLSRDRVELAPGQIAVPNMSRLSLDQYRQGTSVYNGGLSDEESASLHARSEQFRKRWTSQDNSSRNYESYKRYENTADSDCDDVVDSTKISKSSSKHWWITNILIYLYTTTVTSLTTVKNKIWRRDAGQRYPYYNRRYTTSQNSSYVSALKEGVKKRKLMLLFLFLLLLPFIYYWLGYPIIWPFIFATKNSTTEEKHFELTDEILNKIALQVREKFPEINLNSHVIQAVKESPSSSIDPLILNRQQELIDKLYAEINILKNEVAKNSDLDERISSIVLKYNKDMLTNTFGLKAEGSSVTYNDVDAWLKAKTLNKNDLDAKLMDVLSKMNLKLEKKIIDTIKMELGSVQHAAMIGSEGKTVISLDSNCNCDDVIQRIVQRAIAIYDADKTGKVDYALESAGGQVLSTRCTESFQPRTAVFTVFGFPIWYPSNSPRIVLSPGNLPGECWSFQGFPGYLVIKLHTRIFVTGFTIEHTPVELSPTGRIDSAPRKFTVLGLQDVSDEAPITLGTFEYLSNSTSIQYFPVTNKFETPLEITPGYDIVELKIESNQGHPQYTCLYRFRVHGVPVGDISNGNIPER